MDETVDHQKWSEAQNTYRLVAERKRLQELFPKTYVFEYGWLYKSVKVDETTTICKVNELEENKTSRWLKKKISHVIRSRSQMAVVDHANKMIRVYDQSVYQTMKEFGEEFNFRRLIKDWPGAIEELMAKQPMQNEKKVKMVESVDVGTRYQNIDKQT